MAKKKRNYDITHKVMRVLAGDYALLMEISRRAGIPMAEALHKLIIMPQPEPEPAASKSPAQIPMIPVFFKPKSIESNGLKAAHFKPKSISSNGITHIELKSIREV